MTYLNESKETGSISSGNSMNTGCGSHPGTAFDKICCPMCGSDNIGFDFFTNLVCKECGYIEPGSFT